MIEIGLEFPAAPRRPILEAVFSLPDGLRPFAVSYGEDEDDVKIDDAKLFTSMAEASEAGFALKSECNEYDFSFPRQLPISCYFDVDATPEVARAILIHMVAGRPIFGYACDPDERLRRNRAVFKRDSGTDETWLGRRTDKQIPGLYWLTVLSRDLAHRHGVPLQVIADVAREATAIGSEHLLFQFYDRPEDWRSAHRVDRLLASSPGLFDIDAVKPAVAAAKTFMEMQEIIRNHSL